MSDEAARDAAVQGSIGEEDWIGMSCNHGNYKITTTTAQRQTNIICIATHIAQLQPNIADKVASPPSLSNELLLHRPAVIDSIGSSSRRRIQPHEWQVWKGDAIGLEPLR